MSSYNNSSHSTTPSVSFPFTSGFSQFNKNLSSYSQGSSGSSSSVTNVSEEDDPLFNLILSLVSVIILIFFGFKILKNFVEMFHNYYKDVFQNYNNLNKDDDNKYLRNEIEYNNTSNEILQSINNIKLNNKKDFSKLKEYKNKYDLDSINYSQINNKVLSKKYDNYEYNDKPNIIHFIIDVFKPTKK